MRSMREMRGSRLSATAAQVSHQMEQLATEDLPRSWATGLAELPAVAALH